MPTASTPDAPSAEALLLAAQAQARRGLREGPSALRAARGAYLGVQWCGEHDRRPEPGLIRRTRV